MTDKAASTVRQQIDETFAKTISDVGLATTSSLLEFMDGDQIAAYAGNLSGTLAGAITTVRDASGSVDEFAGLLPSSTGLLDSTSDLRARAGAATEDAEARVGDATTGGSGMPEARDAAGAAIAKTISDVGLATTSSLLKFMDGDQIAAYAGNLSGTLAGAITTLRDASGSVDEFAGLLQSSTGLLDSTSDLLASAGAANEDAEALVGDAKTGLSGMHDALDAAVAAINQSLKDSAGDYDAAAKAIDEAFGAADAHVSLTVTQLRDASADVAKRASDMRDVQDNILAVERDVEGSDLPEKLKAELVQKIDIVATAVGNVANQQELLANHLSDAAASLETGVADARAKAQGVKVGIAEAKGCEGRHRRGEGEHRRRQGFL